MNRNKKILSGIRRIKSGLLIGLLVSLCSALAGVESSDTLIVLPGDSVLYLRHGFIVPESLHFENLFYMGKVDIDILNGRVRGFPVPTDTITVIAHYQHLNLQLPTTTFINPPPKIYQTPRDENEESNTPIIKQAITPAVSYDFLKSGTMYRGITIGSQSNFALHSGLNLELDGKLSEDITIQGVLSDQNLPIQPEGNTQTLEEIDKVYIRVNLPHERISFGDYELDFRSMGLGNYYRKLEGINLTSQRANYQTTMAGAVSKGQYYTNYFLGEEGNQGPYQLSGRTGETAIIILAGTERVWVDGQPKLRGENYDYVIDYATAEITFTPRCLITAASRITVDFQYSDLVYQKNIWAVRSEGRWQSERLKLTANFVSESDDRFNPIEVEISNKDRAYLRTIGDAENLAFVGTIHADSGGAYLLKDSILVFAGAGQGTHTATFYNVGKLGRYKKMYAGELTYFQYVDKNNPLTAASDIEQALYLPAKPLRLPRRQNYYYLAGSFQPHKNIEIKSEIARSDLDRNLFSPVDDRDNAGLAYNLETNWTIPFWRNSSFILNGKWQAEENTFNPLDRLQAVEYRRLWNLSSDSTVGARSFLGQAGYNLGTILRINYSIGNLHQHLFKSNRQSIVLTGRFKNLDLYEFSHEDIRSQQAEQSAVRWQRQFARLRLNIWQLQPFGQYRQEIQDGNIDFKRDFRFGEYKIGLKSREEANWRWQLETDWRRDDFHDSTGWKTGTLARNIGFNGQVSRWRAITAQWDYLYRNLNNYQGTWKPGQTFHLLNLLMKYEPLQQAIYGEAVFKIESEKAVKKERRYFYVGKGLGEFLYDSTFADYVAHPRGDYILRVFATNIKEPATRLTNGFRWQFNGTALRKESFLKRITTVTDIRLEQQIRTISKPLTYATFSPAQVDSLFLFFNRQLQQDINWRSAHRRAEWRFRFLKSNQVNQLEVRGLERNNSNEFSIGYRGVFWKESNLESELALRNYQRISSYDAHRNRDINSFRLKDAIAWAFDRRNYFTTEITVMRDVQQDVPDLRAILTGIKFTYEHKVTQKGRWQFFTEIDQVNVRPKGSPIPWEMSNGKKEGTTIGWGISCEYRLGANLTIRANYEGWREPLYPVYHLGSGEIRAYF